jgi:iron-regulated transporter 1
MTTKIAIERDWAIVIAKNAHDNSSLEKDQENESKEENEKRSKEQLANINATVRRFDLSTAIIAPMVSFSYFSYFYSLELNCLFIFLLVAGGIMSFFRISPRFNGTVLSAMFFAGWNVISYFLEYNLLASVYDDVPELKKEKDIKEKKEKNVCVKIKESILGTADGWKAYFGQGLLLMPSIALSILYLTVLSFDSITIGYAKSQKITEQFISILQSVGSVSGVLGTIAYQIMHNKLKIFLPYIGIFGCTYQLLFLFVCFTSMWLPGSVFVLVNNSSTNALHQECLNANHSIALNFTNNINNMTTTTFNQLSKFESFFFESPCLNYTSILVLLIGMALSRFGLWLSDLVIHQIIQENVEEKQRGIIGGAQNSFNTIFDLIKYCLVIFLSDVTQYGYLVIVSVTAVASSAILYIIYAIIDTVSKRFYQPTSDEDQTVYDKSITLIDQNSHDDTINYIDLLKTNEINELREYKETSV